MKACAIMSPKIIGIICTFTVILISGCNRDLYVRDTQSMPVSQANISVQYYSIGGSTSCSKTNEEGYVSVPEPGFLGIETITISKSGYETLTLHSRRDPYIAVLLTKDEAASVKHDNSLKSILP